MALGDWHPRGSDRDRAHRNLEIERKDLRGEATKVARSDALEGSDSFDLQHKAGDLVWSFSTS